MRSKTLRKGSVLQFGRYPQGPNGETFPIDWKVLKAENGKALLISRHILDVRRFDESTNKWDACELRKWLNTEFLKAAFTPQEREDILCDVTSDKAFLLSESEARLLFDQKEDRSATPTPYARLAADGIFTGKKYESKQLWWWLRYATVVECQKKFAGTVGPEGWIDSSPAVKKEGIRPCICLNAKRK